MKRKFKNVNFRAESLARIDQCNKIIADYQSQGLRLTLRQLYYQLITINAFPNIERSYKNLSTLVTDARMAGMMDWDAIEDRARQPNIPQDFKNLEELVDAALASYRLPRWKGQDHYVELWVEKQALAGVLAPIAREYHITLMVNKGYSSASAMYESANRFIENYEEEATSAYEYGITKRMVLLYLGDMDPSGEDMVRDVRERLRTFEAVLTVKKIALTMPQILKYKPPPNPAKVTDPRAAAYIREHGNYSWEVDALPPNILAKLIRAELDALVDKKIMNSVKAQETKDKELLEEAVNSLRVL
jgi:hypothetical protein